MRCLFRNTVVGALKQLCLDLMDHELSSLLEGLLFASPAVRAAALEALALVPALTTGLSLEDDKIASLLFLACHDVDPQNATRAQELHALSRASITEEQLDILCPLMGHQTDDIRHATVGALGEFLETHPRKTQLLITTVIDTLKGQRPCAIQSNPYVLFR